MWRRKVAVCLIAAAAMLAAFMRAAPLQAASRARAPAVSCPKIRAAIAAGRTMDQIIAEFGTDAKQVMKCTQKRGHRKSPKAVKGKKAKAKKPQQTGPEAKRQEGETAGATKPTAPQPRPRLQPRHPWGPRSVQ